MKNGKKLIVANWKMHKTQTESLEFLNFFLNEIKKDHDREVILFPPFTSLGVISKHLYGTKVRLGAQNIHWDDYGSYTGSISGLMLGELDVKYVIVNHYERLRCEQNPYDKMTNLRLKAAQRHAITPILCVGETQEQRNADETEKLLTPS